LPRRDKEHFEQYTDQNRVKHEILTKYLGAYVVALRDRASLVHYVDGFAGAGIYAKTHSGSPLLALDLLKKHGNKFSISLVEEIEDHFQSLCSALEVYAGTPNLVDGIYCEQGVFHDHIDAILSRPFYRTHRSVATFAFVDPCGAEGVHLADLGKVLCKGFGECLLLWNYDAINRWLGLVRSHGKSTDKLVEIFGNSEAVSEALQIYDEEPEGALREGLILEVFVAQVRDYATHIVPFCIKAKKADRTSHYLIHCCNHGVPFKIMKGIMARASTPGGEPGSYEFLSAVKSKAIWSPVLDQTRAAVMSHLAAGPCPVSEFYEDWVLDAECLLIESDFRSLLLGLESAGEVEVLAADGTPAPAEKRPRRKGPTLGPNYLVRLR
jgi:three-Cys-motif partner protein